jgi:hypothetical protein
VTQVESHWSEREREREGFVNCDGWRSSQTSVFLFSFLFAKKTRGEGEPVRQKFLTNRFVGNFIQLTYKINMCPMACEKHI